MSSEPWDEKGEQIVRWLKDENRLQKWEVVDLESDTKEDEANVVDLSMYELSVAVNYEAPDLYEIYKSPASITSLTIPRSTKLIERD